MKRFLSLAALALFGVLAAAEAEAVDPVGVRNLIVPAPERGSQIKVTLWYPAAKRGTPVLIGDNAVFQGASAHQDAPIADGSFPVVLLAHGGLRSAPGLDGWIAAQLAADGFVVATPRASGPAAPAAADAPHEIWLRPADLSATLTALERDPALIGKINLRKVGVLGFQLGGTSALALAGARMDAQAYARSCDEGGAGLDCAWFRRNGVDLHKIDAAKVARSNLDPRVRAVVAVDPEHAADLAAASLSAISVPVHIINLGRAEAILPGMKAAGLERLIPQGHYESIADATRFDAFGLCKPAGSEVLRAEGDDEALCRDGDAPRAAIHARLRAMIAAAFRDRLGNGS